MKLESARIVKTRYPDGTKSPHVQLTFADEHWRVLRNVKISSCAASVSKELRSEALYQLTKAWKEAAIALNSRDERPSTPEDRVQLQKALDLLLKIAGD